MPTLNGGYRHQERIGPGDDGVPVLGYLVRTHPQASEPMWLSRIETGQVWLDHHRATLATCLKAGQTLVWERPPWEEPEVPMATAILYEDEHLLAVAKPSGLPTLPGGGVFQDHTLLALVRRRHPGANPMHRLGRGTSGLVLFAPTDRTSAALQAAFRGPGTRKVYRALCLGSPPWEALDIQAPIGEVPYGPLGRLHAAAPGGKPAASHVQVLERRPGATLVEVDLRTGRPHQIRIHLAWAGHPLLGDPLYGPGGIPLPGCTAVPGDLGYLLHAHRLELSHPATGARLLLSCPPPPALKLTERSQATA